MTTITTAIGSVKFRWVYGRFSKKNPLDLLENETLCEVTLTTDYPGETDSEPCDTEVKVASGLSFKSEKDVFSRPVARRYSLKRALDSSDFNYSERKRVWDAFHVLWPPTPRR
jgi:hypothetical protein